MALRCKTGLSRGKVLCTDWYQQAEFLYKTKPKLPAQFKAAEANGVPFAIFVGEDEVAQNKIKIKEMGLPEGHPEKEGVLVDMDVMTQEVKVRLQRRADVEEVAKQAEGLKVKNGIKGRAVGAGEKDAACQQPTP